MADTNPVTSKTTTQTTTHGPRPDEPIANMDGTDWITLLQEMRIISA